MFKKQVAETLHNNVKHSISIIEMHCTHTNLQIQGGKRKRYEKATGHVGAINKLIFYDFGSACSKRIQKPWSEIIWTFLKLPV
jgi:hypothetical protein